MNAIVRTSLSLPKSVKNGKIKVVITVTVNQLGKIEVPMKSCDTYANIIALIRCKVRAITFAKVVKH
jgi:hypothetical protein